MRLRLVSLLLLTGLIAAGQTVLPLWPRHETGPIAERDTTTDKDQLIAGKRVERLTGVTNPTITLYPAAATNNTAAVVVFPGGGYRILALDLEGTEVCDWLNSIGVTCVLLKYRVPDAGPYPKHSEDLADAQRAVRLTRQHAAEWKIDSSRVGVSWVFRRRAFSRSFEQSFRRTGLSSHRCSRSTGCTS
jgi:acetyl esterase/lipase